MRRTELIYRRGKKEKRGVGRGNGGKKKQIISDNFISKWQATWQLFLNKATNISGEVNLPVIQFRM